MVKKKELDEAASSPAGGAGEAGREPVQPEPADQSGSTGRATGDGDPAHQGRDAGQGRYGQSGLGGNSDSETQGQEDYRKSEADGDPQTRSRSNPGSGTVEHENAEYRDAHQPRRPHK